MTRLAARRGIALIAALTLMTLLGIVVAALVASSISAQRATRLGQSDATALFSAEYAVATVLGDQSTYPLATLPLGQPRRFVISVAQTSSVRVDVAATRLPRGVLWLVGNASVTGVDSSERRVNLVAQFPNVAPLPLASIMSHGAVSLAADVIITIDTTGDADCAARATAPMVVTPSGASVIAEPSVRTATLPSAADSNSYLLTNWQRSLLRPSLGLKHVIGDTAIGGGSFDGILMVDGALNITGPFVVNGLVVASGSIRDTVGGLSVMGAILSAYSGPGRAVDLAGANVRFAPCLVANALRLATPPRRVRDRSWAELF
jgi:hypothetical protein